VGWNVNDQRRTINTSTITGFLVNSKKETTNLNTAAEASTISNSKRNIRSNRGYGILSFDIDDQLFVSTSGALEAASSVKGTFFYPSVDAAWQFTKTALKSDLLSFGKLRASWGKVGVQPIPHRFQTLAESGFSYSTYSDPLDIALFGGGFRLDDDKGNPDLEPEVKTEWEIGTDLRFFRDALSVSMTYYQNNIDGILISVDQTPSSGFDTQYANAAEMENKGFEVEATYNILHERDYGVGLFANWSTNKNEVLDLEGTETINLTPGASVSSRAIVGHALGVLYGTGSQVDDNGNFILDDNGFPQITSSPVVLGDPNPDWRAGAGLNAHWKNLALNIIFEHSHGGEFSPRTLWVLRRFGTTKETANRVTLTQDLVNYAGDVIPAGTTVRGNIEDFGGGPVLL
ncbi:MAG: TonB-dependent receptor, partial [Gammaproteobacteria bacterium]